jgi:hypothetical protein
VGSSISSWAGAPAILDNTASAFEDWRLECSFARRNRSCALSSTAPLTVTAVTKITKVTKRVC